MARFSFPPLAAGPPSRRNWYKDLLDDLECKGASAKVQEAYETHRETWREKQIELFANTTTNPVTPDRALIKHLRRQEKLDNGHSLDEKDDTDAQEMNCCVIWARPPSSILDVIQTIQEDLLRIIGDDVYLIPRKDLHLSVIELSHRHTVPQLRNVAAEIGISQIQGILNLVSTLSIKPKLVAPTISFDKMGIALNYLPSDTDIYTYHHLRSDMHALALESGVTGIDCCYTAPSAHITIGKFVKNKFFETAEARNKFVKLVKDFNAMQRKGDHTWAVGENQGFEMQLGYLKFGRESSKADLVGEV
ncbi:RNA ligase/cyclic nucleotide phosphodiesterase [Boeremia exigua]|uniref:RNA ligase/cyclic nucleotide phosphodiesterase n=1 Tax=Boeremia exigua TaxID=749465 RepID=UPI001E8EA052|nr:RNA ligase/cyclic nucleotide phosphodiesterase [Boeremia exigua]KAH6616539.1 RNA ligase/cyclic nucleotide phosphodiesterase [Boeremia exigua]